MLNPEKRIEARKKAKSDKKEASARKQLEKQLKREAKEYEEKIIKIAWNRNFRQVLRGELTPSLIDVLGGDRKIRKLKFTHVLYDEYRLWFRIDSDDLPGISHRDIYDEDFIYDLERGVNKTVKYDGNPKSGDFIIIERDSGISGIPKYLSMAKAYQWIPADADPLTWCIGQTENNQPVIVSLLPLPHLLLAGTTRSGKTVQLNNMLCTFITRSGPDKVRFALIDLKHGVEFRKYSGLPHLLQTETPVPGIAFDAEQAKVIFRAILGEINDRGEKFSKVGAANIDEYHNVQKFETLPYLVVCIDELSVLLFHEDKEIRNYGKFLMNKMLATGAAYGIHIVPCTQDPTREIIPRHLKANLPARCCFRTTSIASSVAMLENKNAHRLKPKGRGIFQFDDEIQFQGPFISPAMVQRHVKRMIDKWSSAQNGDQRIPLGLHHLLLYALEHRKINDNEFSLAWQHLAEVFAPQGLNSKRIKAFITEAHWKEYVFEGRVYQVQPNRGQTGTRLVFIRNEGESDATSDVDLLAAD